MKVDVLDALLASAVFYCVVSNLFWVNKTLIDFTADALFDHIERQYEEQEEDEDEDEDEDLPGRVLRVQVIDEVGKKCH